MANGIGRGIYNNSNNKNNNIRDSLVFCSVSLLLMFLLPVAYSSVLAGMTSLLMNNI